MNTTTKLIAAATLAFAGAAAMAQDITPDNLLQPVSMKTRDQVSAELVAARKDGTTKAWSVGYMEKTAGRNTRDQVLAELASARRSGELAAINSDTASFQRADAMAMMARAGR